MRMSTGPTGTISVMDTPKPSSTTLNILLDSCGIAVMELWIVRVVSKHAMNLWRMGISAEEPG